MRNGDQQVTGCLSRVEATCFHSTEKGTAEANGATHLFYYILITSLCARNRVNSRAKGNLALCAAIIARLLRRV